MAKPDFSSGGLYGKDVLFRLLVHSFQKRKNLSADQKNMLNKAEAALPTNAEKNKNTTSLGGMSGGRSGGRSASITAAKSAASRTAKKGRSMGRSLLLYKKA